MLVNAIVWNVCRKLSEKVIYWYDGWARPGGRGLVVEAGRLALGVAFRRRLAVGDRCTAVALTRKPGGDLGHADRPPDRRGGGQVGPREQAPHFVDCALIQHRLEPSVAAREQPVAIGQQHHRLERDPVADPAAARRLPAGEDRKSTRLNPSH